MKRRRGLRRGRRGQSSRGFTLLEVVLALGLTSLLLAAVYSALQMHWMYSYVGQVEMERAQVARALFRRIEIDLRSVVIQRSTPTTDDGSTTGAGTSSSSSASGTNSGTGTSSGGSQTGGSSSGSSSTSGGSSGTTTDSTETTSPQKTGLWGDSQTLIVHVTLPSRANSGLTVPAVDPNTGVATQSTELLSIAYFAAGSNSSLAQQFSSSLNATAPSTTGQAQASGGLARMQGDRMMLSQADDSGNVASLAQNAKVIAPEVASIEFEFYDGVSWTTSWDSGATSTIPNAVRVTIDFRPPDKPRGGWFARPISTSSDRFQRVIALPLAEPYVDSSSF